MRNHKYKVFMLAASLALVGCGGGGGDATAPTETTTTSDGTTVDTGSAAPVACSAAPIASTGYSLVFKGCDLANIATYYDKTECVRDNSSGLIWQGQMPAGSGHLRANDQYKTNFDSTILLQKYITATSTFVAPSATDINASTNSIGFKNAVNSSNLCGSAAWRLPSKDELVSIVKTGVTPTIDSEWFPNTANLRYWTYVRFPDGSYEDVAYTVFFNNGSAISGYRDGLTGSGDILVRLVRN